MATRIQVVLDCHDVDSQAEFWAAAAGYVVQPPPPGFADWPAALQTWGVPEDQWHTRSAVIDPEGHQPRIFLQQVPEPKTVKNRVHFDMQVGAGLDPGERSARVAEEVARLEALGARRLATYDELGEHWVVMADPEGNEFCVS